MPNRGPRVNPVVVGVVGAAVMFGLLLFAFTNVALFAHTITVKAVVSSADTLAAGADVEVAGVKIGTVKTIERHDSGALITMTADNSRTTIYKDASVAIRPHGVFGPKFAEITPGSEGAGNFGEGDTIPIDHTSVSVDFEQVLNELDTPTRQSLQTFFYEFGTANENRGQDVGVLIDKLQVVEDHLTPVLVVIDNRGNELGRFIDSSAVVNKTLAESPLDQIIHENSDILAKLDARSGSLTGVVDHGNNVLADLDTITAGGNVNALRLTLQKLPTLLDNLQRLNNDLGQGVNALRPALTPQHGQADSDIAIAVRRTEDAFQECDVADDTNPTTMGQDTLHATMVRIVPCYDAQGRPYVDPATKHVAHHHVKVLLGLDLNNPVGTPGGEEANTICGPNSGNSTRGSNPAFGCLQDPFQSAPIAPFGGLPPALFTQHSAAPSSGASALRPMAPTSLYDLLLGN